MKQRTFRIAAAVALLALIATGVFGVIQHAQAEELEGIADNVTASQLTVGGMTLIITENTTIKGEITTGARLLIRAIAAEDGTLIATAIKVKNDQAQREMTRTRDEEGKEIEGLIDSVQLASDNVTPVSIVIGGRTLEVNGDTEIEGTLAAGTQAEVRTITVDGVLIASKIEIESPDDGEETSLKNRERNEHRERPNRTFLPGHRGERKNGSD